MYANWVVDISSFFVGFLFQKHSCIINSLWDVLVYNIAVYFYEFCSILTSPQGENRSVPYTLSQE